MSNNTSPLHSKKKLNEFNNCNYTSQSKKTTLFGKKKYPNFSLQKNFSSKVNPKPIQDTSPNSIVASPSSKTNRNTNLE